MCKVAQRKVVLIQETLNDESEFLASIHIPFVVDEIRIDSIYVTDNGQYGIPFVLKSDLVKDEIFAVGGTKVMSHRFNECFTINASVNGSYKFEFLTLLSAKLALTGRITIKLEFIKYESS